MDHNLKHRRNIFSRLRCFRKPPKEHKKADDDSLPASSKQSMLGGQICCNGVKTIHTTRSKCTLPTSKLCSEPITAHAINIVIDYPPMPVINAEVLAVLDDEPSRAPRRRSFTTASSSSSSQGTAAYSRTTAPPTTNTNTNTRTSATTPVVPPSPWTCSQCTFINTNALYLACELCGLLRTENLHDGNVVNDRHTASPTTLQTSPAPFIPQTPPAPFTPQTPPAPSTPRTPSVASTSRTPASFYWGSDNDSDTNYADLRYQSSPSSYESSSPYRSSLPPLYQPSSSPYQSSLQPSYQSSLSLYQSSPSSARKTNNREDNLDDTNPNNAIYERYERQLFNDRFQEIIEMQHEIFAELEKAKETDATKTTLNEQQKEQNGNDDNNNNNQQMETQDRFDEKKPSPGAKARSSVNHKPNIKKLNDTLYTNRGSNNKIDSNIVNDKIHINNTDTSVDEVDDCIYTAPTSDSTYATLPESSTSSSSLLSSPSSSGPSHHTMPLSMRDAVIVRSESDDYLWTLAQPDPITHFIVRK